MSGLPFLLATPLQNCVITHVTVYSDRAEISRLVQFTADRVEQGLHDVLVKGFDRRIDGDSFRVKGTGSFEILEVSYEENRDTTPADPTSLSEIEAELRTLQNKKLELEQSIQRKREMARSITGYASNVLSTVTGDHPPSVGAGSVVDVNQMNQLIEFYLTRQQALDEETNEDTSQLAEVNQRISAVTNHFNQLNYERMRAVSTTKDLTISINVSDASVPLEMVFTYVAPNAWWKPAYDMRLSSQDQMISLTYYGVVTQNTGEDWNGCRLSLSTAAPAVHGYPQPLHSKTVALAQGLMWSSNERMLFSSASALAPPPPPPGAAYGGRGGGGLPQEALALTASVVTADAAGSSLFDIPRRAFIASDTKEHKVTIANLQLATTLNHYAAPSASGFAYLQAKTKNTSDYPLLASNKMNVYVDGSLLTKTSLRSISPGEMFSTYIGADPSVKVEYRPVRTSEKTIGWMAKTKQTTYQYCTIVKNTKAIPISMFVVDSLPVSSNEQIEVELTQPVAHDVTPIRVALRTPDDDADPSLTDQQLVEQLIENGRSNMIVKNPTTHNIVWARVVEPSDTLTLPFRYAVSNPTNTLLEIA